MSRWRLRAALIAVAMGVLAGVAARADQTRHFSFAYDQPHSTGYGVAADLFNSKLMELSHGSMAIDQFPGAQLGQEPQMLQKIRTGDIDFMISSTANAATVAPESGVLSIHYLFRSEDQLIKAIGDPRLVAAVKEMFDATVKDGHVLALATLGLRDLYGKRPVTSVSDLKGFKVRVQATPTEDTLFPAYGAQTVHMPFGSVYTSLQTGVVDFAENGVNVYDSNKHYEVAPVLSMTEHEANNSVIWVSDKLWSSLTDEQKGWVQAAAAEVGAKQPAAGDRARAQVARQATKARRQSRHQRRQGELHQDRRTAAGQARQGARPARREDPASLPLDPIAMDGRADLVLAADRHLKWPALDPLERVLMQLCGVCLVGFTSTTLLDVVARIAGHPLLWPQEVTSAFFIYGVFIGASVATRRNDHLQLLALTESMSGPTRRAFEVLDRAVVMGVGVFLVVYGWQNFLTGFGSFRMPSMLPIAYLYAPIPLCGALVALFSLEQIVNGLRHGFESPPPAPAA